MLATMRTVPTQCSQVSMSTRITRFSRHDACLETRGLRSGAFVSVGLRRPRLAGVMRERKRLFGAETP